MKIFPNNSRVCFIGDSITHKNGYVSYIFDYYIQKYKQKNVTFFNCGISGATAKQQIELLNDDILLYKPTHAVIMLGVNDSRHPLLGEMRDGERYAKLVAAFEEYQKNIEILCNGLREKNVEIILCTPAPYDEFTLSEVPSLKGGYALIQGYSEFIRDFAAKKGIAVCDYHKYMTQIIQSETIYESDHVHPNARGQFYMAKCFLQFQGEDLGDFFPLPQYLDEWRDTVKHLRDVYSAEHLMLHSFFLDSKEGTELIHEYLEKKPNVREVYKYLAQQYFLYKPKQNDLRNEIICLTNAFYESSC